MTEVKNSINTKKTNKTKQTPLVSVIIPFFNTAEYIGRCLESVLGQTLSDIEIICIDDGSTDDSLAIVESYADKDNRIRIIKKRHTNTGDSRNTGLDEAKGEYISFVDADDFIEPDMLEKAYGAISEPDSDIVWFRSDFWEHNRSEFVDNTWALRDWEMPAFRPFSSLAVSEKIFNLGSGTPCDKLFKKSFLEKEKIRFQNISTCDDFLFTNIALVSSDSITTIGDVLYHQRIGHTKHFSENIEKTTSNYYKAILEIKNTLLQRDSYELFRKSFLNWAVDFSLWFYDQFQVPLLRGLMGEQLKKSYLKDLGVYDFPEEEYYNHDFFDRVDVLRDEANNAVRINDFPEVTVIVPVLNAGVVLESCLERLVYQTLNNIEIIIVNDGSDDASSDIIACYAFADSRITVINNDETRGHGAAVNQGIKAAKADFISIVEPFDTFDVTLIEKLYKPVIEHNLDFAKGDIAKLKHDDYGNLKIDYRMLALMGNNYNRVIDSSNERIWKDFMHSPYCAVYKKSFLEENEIFFDESEDATFTDEEFVFKTDIYAHRVMYVLETLYYDTQKSYLFSGYPMTELLSG